MKTPALVPVPPNLGALMHLVNLLPKALRRSAKAGIHELTLRSWNSDSEEEAITSWFYFWRYVNPLPIGLQAFVLHDDEGLHSETGAATVPLFDAYHLQPYQNIDLSARSDDELRGLVSKAKERVRLEIKMLEEKILLQKEKENIGSVSPLDAQRLMTMIPGWRREYRLGESTFSELGPRCLVMRARQRFFFVLAADEILHALTNKDPQQKLNQVWYSSDSGTLTGHLFVENDQVHLFPPVLFSFVVGVQVSRIRKCAVCENYFWAGRKDKSVCSSQCGANRRKRRERDRYMEIKLGDRKPGRRSI